MVLLFSLTMITDKDIAQALKSKKTKPSKEWQNATLQRLRDISSENHVTDSTGMRISPRDAVASLASYFFPTSIMNSVALKTIGSLAAMCVIAVGTHAVVNGSTSENSFLYTLDRGFERAEIAFAKIGGKAYVAHKHLIHAEERATEIDALLRGEASASVSLRDVLIQTAYAQSVGANAQLSTRVQLLVDDCRDSLNKAVATLEEIADSASAKTRAELAIAIEMTSKNISQRLEAGMQASAEADIRPVVRRAVVAAKEAERKARTIQAQIEFETEASAEVNDEREKKDNSASVKENTETKDDVEIDLNTDVDVEADTSIDSKLDINTQGGLNLNLNTSSKRNSGGRATTEADANTEAESKIEASANADAREDAANENNSSSDSFDDTLNTEAETGVNVEADGNADIDSDSGAETHINTKVEDGNSLYINK